MINEVEVGHDVLGSGSEVLNVAIIAPRDEAWSPDFDRFELVCNRFGSSFLERFGQKISDRKSIRKFGWMRTGKFSDSLGDWRWVALKDFKWVGFERLFGSRRSHITQER